MARRQVARIVRHRGDPSGRRTAKEIVHVITSAAVTLADPAVLAALVRGHCSIEALHHIRDATFGEDAHRARTAHAPAVLAVIRNTITAAIRLAGLTNIAAARRDAPLEICAAIACSPAGRNRTHVRYHSTLREQGQPEDCRRRQPPGRDRQPEG